MAECLIQQFMVCLPDNGVLEIVCRFGVSILQAYRHKSVVAFSAIKAPVSMLIAD